MTFWREILCLFRGARARNGCCMHPTGVETESDRMHHVTGRYPVTREEVICCHCQFRDWRTKRP